MRTSPPVTYSGLVETTDRERSGSVVDGPEPSPVSSALSSSLVHAARSASRVSAAAAARGWRCIGSPRADGCWHRIASGRAPSSREGPPGPGSARHIVTSVSTVARLEREALCDLFLEVGPDAPTLCGDWTTRDLAAHLVVRDRNLLGGAGIVLSTFAGFTEKGMEREETRPWSELVERVRSGPMWFAGPVDSLINTVEYFVHHEDVRRGDGTGEPRQGIDDVEDEL